MRTRGFEVVKRFEDRGGMILPKRSTVNAAGYDFFANEDIVIPSLLPDFIKLGFSSIIQRYSLELGKVEPFLVKTGIKAYMKDDEVLVLANRSSNPKKLGLILSNGIGVVDSDYYSNEDNDGEIAFAFYNIFPTSIKIIKGDKIGQGIFMNFFKADGDSVSDIRRGGFGSTGK